jgi:transcriptional regulator with XRE-family HTH domain
VNEKKNLPNTRPKRRRGPERPTLTPNQIVAYNLTRARQLRGWTQQQVADALEPHLGVRWSPASVSQSERSVTGRFIRQFDADEIVAFARAFNLPLVWFLLPPPEEGAGLIDVLFGTDENMEILWNRLAEFVEQLETEQLTSAQQRLAQTTALRGAAIVRHRLGDLRQWQESLHQIADVLADLEGQLLAAEPSVEQPARALPHPPSLPMNQTQGGSMKHLSRRTGTRKGGNS